MNARNERVVYRVRCIVTRAWKLRNYNTGVPFDYPTAAQARRAARFLKHWRVVKVTIRKRSTSVQSPKSTDGT